MDNFNYTRYRFLKVFKSWRNKYIKPKLKKEASRLKLYDLCVKEISEYTGEDEGEVKRKHHLGPEAEKDYSIFKKEINPSREAVEKFYRDCYYYLYELPLWNAECNRPKYLFIITLPYLKRQGYQKVMDFGAGTGDLCIELAKNNLDVTYCDIGQQLYDFAKWRFARRKLNIKMVKSIENLGNEIYDCIFSFDAFEHVKDLPQILNKLTRHIKSGGSLIFSGAFSGGTLHLEENEKYNDFKNLDVLMRSHGLSFQDKFAQFYFYKKLP